MAYRFVHVEGMGCPISTSSSEGFIISSLFACLAVHMPHLSFLARIVFDMPQLPAKGFGKVAVGPCGPLL